MDTRWFWAHERQETFSLHKKACYLLLLFSIIFLCYVENREFKIGAKVIKKMLKSESFIEKKRNKEKNICMLWEIVTKSRNFVLFFKIDNY